MKALFVAALVGLLSLGAVAQESVEELPLVEAAPEPCGTQPVSIASMPWPSAQILAEIHARVLTQNFGCVVRVVPGDLAATGSSMASTGQPGVAPEMWTARITEIWNAGIKGLKLRPVGSTYGEAVLEGWFIPEYTAAAHPELGPAAQLAGQIALLTPTGARPRFISCPPDWACSVINRNLLQALGLLPLVDLVEPANRFEMDQLIADAFSKQEPVLFYYWQPNPALSQFTFKPIDLGPFDPDAFACLGRRVCAAPKATAFASEPVVIALAEWLFVEAPGVAGYFQRAAMPIETMNALLAQLNEPGATPESVADRFIAEQGQLWRPWAGLPAPEPVLTGTNDPAAVTELPLAPQ